MQTKLILVLFAAAIMVFFMAEAREEGPHDMADALRMLQELDRYYMQAARPSIISDNSDKTAFKIGRRDVPEGDRVDPDTLDRAVRLLQLHNFDRIYSHHTRPRYGKRSESYSNWAKDIEKPDIPSWLYAAQRR